MKTSIKSSFSQLLTNRHLLVLSVSLIILAISFAIYIGLNVRPSELQLVTHYSAFGVTHLYRDQWFYLLSFGVFGIIVAVLHIIIATKIFIMKGPSLAILVNWLGIVIILFAWATAYALLNVWSPS